ncbi:hypothetical protein PASLES1_27050 [Pseudomonas aeruginosa]|uniref:putative holin n=13 Tax=Pseudomonas aeruginosa TaxID=287 RepID=UPI0032E961BA
MSSPQPRRRRAPRMTSWTLVTLVLLIILAAIRPEQLQVVAYKLVLVTLGAVAGYWIDRSLFPYVARPHECSANLVVVGAWLRRGLIVLACILGLTLGPDDGRPANHLDRPGLCGPGYVLCVRWPH